MSGKAEFTIDEWDLLRSSPLMASLLVVAASPNGPIGLMQESAAAARMIMQTAGAAQTPLLKVLAEDVVQTMSIPKPPPGATPQQVQAAAAEILRRSAALLEGKASPAEANEIKEWLVNVSQATAEAAREGGFLGFGGRLISDQEKAALAQVKSALALEAA
jgi:hypothetical protein